ncbi:MAG: bifunctional DedA family/phosphatase PAP2 family protein [Solirubrobacterales bacterium]
MPPLAITLPHASAAVAAFVWAGLLIWWHRRGELNTERKIVGPIGVVLLALFSAGAFSGIPRPEEILENISGALGKWTYLLVGVLAFLETGAFVGLIAPGEAAVIVGGVVAGQGDIDIRLLIGIVWFAAFCGDSASYYVGKRLGREFLVKHGAKLKITEARLEQVERYMRDHGGKTILIGRFIGLVRALAPFIAGSSHMPYKRFMPYDVIGSGLWAATFCMLGYIFSNNLSKVIDYAERGVLIFGWTVGTIVLIVYLVRRFRKPEERAKLSAWLDVQEKHPRRAWLIKPLRAAWRRVALPIAQTLAPQVRFAWRRFTPGGLGLEFTTTIAILMTAAFTFDFYTVAALDFPSNEFANRLNDAAFRVCDSLRTDWLDSIAQAITNLGAFWCVAPIVLLATLYCLSRRRVPEAVVLVVSLITTLVFVNVFKNWTQVPRPPAPLTSTSGWSFPSGHAAYAVSYVAIAVSLNRIGGIFTRAAVIVAAIVLGGVVALSRVYLRAHYLTDVIGGTALAFLSLALFTAIAMLIVHLRQLRRGQTPVPSAAAESAGAGDTVA